MLRAGAFLLLAAATLATPLDGAFGLAKILGWAAFLCLFILPSPCRSGAAYPFRHGFRAGAACAIAPSGDQGAEGTTSAGADPVAAPRVRFPAT
ncbi:MAG: hypothetical protein C3F11_16175 [Methylocystaceae bacterium]|nr:MAG: hypothetical protein C3F11_16175 [Methylocystaceae bacterium]